MKSIPLFEKATSNAAKIDDAIASADDKIKSLEEQKRSLALVKGDFNKVVSSMPKVAELFDNADLMSEEPEFYGGSRLSFRIASNDRKMLDVSKKKEINNMLLSVINKESSIEIITVSRNQWNIIIQY